MSKLFMMEHILKRGTYTKIPDNSSDGDQLLIGQFEKEDSTTSIVPRPTENNIRESLREMPNIQYFAASQNQQRMGNMNEAPHRKTLSTGDRLPQTPVRKSAFLPSNSPPTTERMESMSNNSDTISQSTTCDTTMDIPENRTEMGEFGSLIYSQLQLILMNIANVSQINRQISQDLAVALQRNNMPMIQQQNQQPYTALMPFLQQFQNPTVQSVIMNSPHGVDQYIVMNIQRGCGNAPNTSNGTIASGIHPSQNVTPSNNEKSANEDPDEKKEESVISSEPTTTSSQNSSPPPAPLEVVNEAEISTKRDPASISSSLRVSKNISMGGVIVGVTMRAAQGNGECVVFKCIQCGESLKTKRELLKHVNVEHIKDMFGGRPVRKRRTTRKWPDMCEEKSKPKRGRRKSKY